MFVHGMIRAVIALVAFIWCLQMAMRFRADLEEFRTTTDGTARAVTGFLWALTAYAAWLVVSFAWDVAEGLGVL